MQKSTTPLQGPKKRTLKLISTVGILFLLCLLPLDHAWAKTYRVLIISSGDSSVYEKVIDTIQSTVASSTDLSAAATDVAFDVVFLKDSSTAEQLQVKIKDQDLLLTIGQRAMLSVTELKDSPPTLVTLIPKQSYDKYRTSLQKINPNTTAIFIDNPPIRQILLAKIILGGIQRLGVIIGEKSPYKKDRILSDIQQLGIKSRIETVREKDNLIRKLTSVLSDSDAFLALPDVNIFNRRTAKNILLTTYRHRTPVIAYSESYVKAGALAAVYSTPQQIAKQTADTLITIFTSKTGFPQQDAHPNEFEISVNKNVAKSLDIPTLSESAIKEELLEKLGKKE